MLRWLYWSLFQLGLRLGCSNFYFKCQNRKNKIKYIIIIFIFWFNSGGSFEPPGLQVEPPLLKNWITQISIFNLKKKKIKLTICWTSAITVLFYFNSVTVRPICWTSANLKWFRTWITQILNFNLLGKSKRNYFFFFFEKTNRISPFVSFSTDKNKIKYIYYCY